MNEMFIKVGVAYVGALTVLTILLTSFRGGYDRAYK